MSRILKVQVDDTVAQAKSMYLPDASFVKGTSDVLASNLPTQAAQTAWKYFSGGVVHVYKAAHSGASQVFYALFSGDGNEDVSGSQLDMLAAGLILTRLSPSRIMLAVSIMWANLKKEQKEFVLAHVPADHVKAYSRLFDAIANFAKVVLVQGAAAKTRKTRKATFSDIAKAPTVNKEIKSGKKTLKDLSA